MNHPACNGLPPWQLYRTLTAFMGVHRTTELQALVTRRGSWPALLQLAEEHQVLPSLAHVLSRDPTTFDELPSRYRERLTASLRQNVRRNLGICNSALRVARLLNGEGISPVFFKGAAGLLTGLYPTIGYRRLADIDFLVEAAQQQTAIEAMRAAGYEYCVETQERGASRLRVTTDTDDRAHLIRRYRYHHHYAPLLKAGDGASLELHRHPLAQRWQQRLPLREFHTHLTEHCRHGVNFQTPNPELGITLAILSRFASDGLRASFDFPLAQAGDTLCHLASPAVIQNGLDTVLLNRYCGRHFPLFMGVLADLTGTDIDCSGSARRKTATFLGIMERKLQQPLARRLIDAQGRVRQVVDVVAHNPLKLARRLGV